MIAHKDYMLLLSALSHEIRTPLSVISNEASFLSMTAASPESEKILTKVQEISNTLKSWQIDTEPEQTINPELQLEILDQVRRDYPNVSLRGSNPFASLPNLSISSSSWGLLLRTLIECFPSQSNVELAAYTNGFVLEKPDEDRHPDREQSIQSFSHLFNEVFGRHRVVYFMIDAALSKLALESKIVFEQDVCQIKIYSQK